MDVKQTLFTVTPDGCLHFDPENTLMDDIVVLSVINSYNVCYCSSRWGFFYSEHSQYEEQPLPLLVFHLGFRLVLLVQNKLTF